MDDLRGSDDDGEVGYGEGAQQRPEGAEGSQDAMGEDVVVGQKRSRDPA